MIGEHEVRSLLSSLCVELGFCLAPAQIEEFTADPPGTVIEFTNAVFRAEGLAPETAARHLFRQVRDRVSEAFTRGADRQLLERILEAAEQRSDERQSR